MEQISDVNTVRKGPLSPPEHIEKQREHEIYVLASRLEEDFACVSSTTPLGVWYIDNGASAHMTRVRECFSSYQEEQMNFQITMGNKAKYTPHQERYRNISDGGWQQDSSHECSACTRVRDEFTLGVSTSKQGL